jgi:isoleucyl-tRNA synthetase
MSEKITFKNTVHLPKTEFPIRAQLQQQEPVLLQAWDQADGIARNLDDSTYILHDGPPYPNGAIHMGHALNKVLKDIIVRSKIMYGEKSAYVPGWDCHGLPIETQVIKELKTRNEILESVTEFRDLCKDFALKYVDLQKSDFKRLGIAGNWNDPYLTLNSDYESHVIRLFGQIAKNGLIYKGRKPIHWCIHCETALAEAEIEYQNHKSPSIFLTFPLTHSSPTLKTILKNQDAALLVWTTTPWTLPANVAVAAHPEFSYTIASSDRHPYLFIFATALHASLSHRCGVTLTPIATISGKELADSVAQNPLMHRAAPVVLASFVTQEEGSGFVHIAPGHGQEDYQVGLQYQLPVLMPVDAQGKFTDEVEWQGQSVFSANKSIGQKLDSLGHLIKLEFISHAYPHCWRCKNPVIFRATSQWFIAMDKPLPDGQTLRQKALEAIQTIEWFPQWGQKRIFSMLENRPDWCISRQRHWGIPIPVLTCASCGKPDLSETLNHHLEVLIREKGTRIWFEEGVEHLLIPKGYTCADCHHPVFNKEKDILDVWFESGSSFGAVLKSNCPANLYLEGSDQHRGWFQSSLLIALAATGIPPFKQVLTHGFLVDEKGHKMSKSQGNVISPQSIVNQYGADVLRWWVANSDFKQDIGISDSIFKQMQDSFSKVRNTIRFCLSNLFDFDPSLNSVKYSDSSLLDQYILNQLLALNKKVQNAYQQYDIHVVAHAIHDYCAVTLSS